MQIQSVSDPVSPRKANLSRLLKAGLWISPLLLLITLMGWGLSSPAGSSPDDDFHMASIWCAYGEREGICERGAEPEQRLVPAAILQSPCFAFHPSISGSCQNGITEQSSDILLPVEHGNWNGQIYPPVFYAVFGTFASTNIAVSVILIRFVNALLATALLTVTMVALPRRLRPILGFSAALTLVPLGLSLIPSTNPSSWALISALLVFPTVLAVRETRGSRRSVLVALGLIGAAIGAGARADAALFAALGALIAWWMSKGHQSRATTLTTIAIVSGSIVAFFSAGQAGALGGLGDSSVATGQGGLALAIYNLTQLPALWGGMFTNLGWLDTAISPLALFGVLFALIGILFNALGTLDSRKAFALFGVAASLAVVPLYMLSASGASVGSQVQPRYVLPLLILLVAVAVTPKPTSLVISSFQVWTIAALVAGAHTLALFDQLTRYVAGERVLNLDSGNWWWGGSPLSPMEVLGCSAMAFTLLLAALSAGYIRIQRFAVSTNAPAAAEPFVQQHPVLE